MKGASDEQGQKWIEKAKALHREVMNDGGFGELNEGDFDDLVVFWSR
jgi:hypothetical protein